MKTKFRLSILALAIMVSVGLTVGGFANADTLKDTILDKVADKIAEKILGSFEQDIVSQNEQALGISTADNLILSPTSVIYFGDGKTSGLRLSGGVVQYKNTSGSWSSVGAAVASNGGWAADGTNNRMYPTNNTSGSQYPVLIGTTSTSTPANSSTIFYVSGQSVFTGLIRASSTLEVEGATKLYSTLGVTGAATLSSTLASGALTVTGAATISSTLAVTGTLTQTGAASFASTVALAGTASTTGSAVIRTASIDSTTGAISFNDENLTTTGTLASGALASGALTVTGAATVSTTLGVTGATTLSNTLAVTGATTITAGLTVDTSTLVVNSSTNRVGIGTTTPAYPFSITDTGSQVMIAYDTTNYATLAVGSGGDTTILSTGGDISFSNENLATTGTLASGALTVTGSGSFSTTLSAATTTISTGLIVDTNTLLVDGINNRVGIGSTTPAATLGIGTSMTSTSTIMMGKFCMITAQENGTVVYLRLGSNQAANSPFATSTTPCNQ